MNELKEAKIKSLKMINEWCQNLLKDTDKVLDCGYILRCNNRNYRVSVSHCGIFVKGDGRFSNTFMVRPEEISKDNLLYQVAGTELIYQWKYIKSRILDKFSVKQEQERMMLNFEV